MVFAKASFRLAAYGLGVSAPKPGLPCDMAHAVVRSHVPRKTAFGWTSFGVDEDSIHVDPRWRKLSPPEAWKRSSVVAQGLGPRWDHPNEQRQYTVGGDWWERISVTGLGSPVPCLDDSTRG